MQNEKDPDYYDRSVSASRPNEYNESSEESISKYQSPPKNQEGNKALVEKNKSKLEKLLAQSDIFDCLRRINQGLIRSYDDLGD